MSIPYRFDDSNTERSAADGMLASLGITNEIWTKKSGVDKSVGLTGIGNLGPASTNPLGVGPTPALNFQQPNPAPPATAPVPPGNFNPMKVSASGNYQQPNTQNPAPRASGQISAKNPLGC
jgi:hypothetical protein